MTDTIEPQAASAADESGIVRAVRWVACVGAMSAALGCLAFGFRFGLGLACGAGLATANLWALGRVVFAFLQNRGRAAPWAAISALKMLALFAIAYVLLKRGIAPPLPFSFGYLALPIGIVASQLFGSRPSNLDHPA